MKQLAIYDSGLGGYSIYHDLKLHFPNLDLVLYADQKHAPYGNRSYESLLDVSINAIESIVKDGFKDILVACNTISATSLSTLKLMFPDVNIIGIIDLTTSQIKKDDVLVLATQATIASRAYEIALSEFSGVLGCALPDLVSYIETLASDDDIESYLRSFELLTQPFNTIVLACTHYPLVKGIIERINAADIVDSRAPIRAMISQEALTGTGNCVVKTSGDPTHLKHQIQALFHEDEEVLVWNL